MKKPYRQADGFYHVDGKKYKTLFGSREQVMNGTVHKTTGGLTKADLVMNKWGRIVSAKKFKTAKKEMRLQKHGFFAKKGKFGAITRKFRGGQDADDEKKKAEDEKKRAEDELTDDEKKAAAEKITNINPDNIPANTFVAPVPTTTASTGAAPTTTASTGAAPTTTASTGAATTLTPGGANIGADKSKNPPKNNYDKKNIFFEKGPQKYDEDGHPINKQKSSNKKKSSPKPK